MGVVSSTIGRSGCATMRCCRLSLLATAISVASGFVSPPPGGHSSALSMVNAGDEVATSSRRRFIDSLSGGAAAVASSVLFTPSPALAYGLGKANDKLKR